jgi:hypothetical protein
MAWIVALAIFLGGSPIAMARESSSAPIPLQYFGLHIHRADAGTAWPKVPFGSWRLWDSYVGWRELEPKRGVWNFTRLDRYVAMAGIAKVDILLPLAMTPRWASARPDEPSAYQPGNVAEPAKLADWSNYVGTVGARYKGRIKYYEVWNEPSDKTHYSGDLVTLVKLTCEAKRVLKEIDPAIRIVSPASAGGGRHIEYLDQFLAAGGRDCIDIVGHHFYVFNRPPEAMIPLIRQVKGVMAKNGVGSLPLWNTETGWWIENGDGTPDHPMVAKGGWKRLGLEKESGDYVMQAFLLARAEGVDRFFWYSWDNHSLGFIEPSTGKLKPAVDSWREIVKRLEGARDLRCMKQARQWSCGFTNSLGVKDSVSWTAE